VLIRDNDATYGAHFTAVALGNGSEVLRTPIKAPRASANCECLLGSVRRECLDHLMIVSEEHGRRVLKTYVAYFNQARPHQGIEQRIPASREHAVQAAGDVGTSLPTPCSVVCTTITEERRDRQGRLKGRGADEGGSPTTDLDLIFVHRRNPIGWLDDVRG